MATRVSMERVKGGCSSTKRRITVVPSAGCIAFVVHGVNLSQRQPRYVEPRVRDGDKGRQKVWHGALGRKRGNINNDEISRGGREEKIGVHPIDITGPRGCERSVSIQQHRCKLRVECHASDRDAGGDRRGFEQKFGANSKVTAAAAQRLLSMSKNSKQLKPEF
jgi:hypothetical protein